MSLSDTCFELSLKDGEWEMKSDNMCVHVCAHVKRCSGANVSLVSVWMYVKWQNEKDRLLWASPFKVDAINNAPAAPARHTTHLNKENHTAKVWDGQEPDKSFTVIQNQGSLLRGEGIIEHEAVILSKRKNARVVPGGGSFFGLL